MVGHDDEFIDLYARMMGRNFLPPCGGINTHGRQIH
jgi:hypothetical protein